MRPVSLDIANYLQDQSVGTIGTDIFVGYMPDTNEISNNVIAIYDTGGGDPHWDELNFVERYPTFQIAIRNNQYIAGYNRIETVRSTLNNLTDHTATDSRYLVLHAKSDILYAGVDDKGRHIFTLNFRTIRTDS
ncbi:MAG: hypothetical protein GF411_03165 [Candidatus Lokiarchaeota archaeon]|nr:hypothetical protein [Candidatus Lokiarchaeota archaeon]